MTPVARHLLLIIPVIILTGCGATGLSVKTATKTTAIVDQHGKPAVGVQVLLAYHQGADTQKILTQEILSDDQGRLPLADGRRTVFRIQITDPGYNADQFDTAGEPGKLATWRTLGDGVWRKRDYQVNIEDFMKKALFEPVTGKVLMGSLDLAGSPWLGLAFEEAELKRLRKSETDTAPIKARLIADGQVEVIDRNRMQFLKGPLLGNPVDGEEGIPIELPLETRKVDAKGQVIASENPIRVVYRSKDGKVGAIFTCWLARNNLDGRYLFAQGPVVKAGPMSCTGPEAAEDKWLDR